MSKSFLFASFNPHGGCDHHRIMLPWRHLEADFPDLEVELSVGDPHGDYHYILTHGLPSPALLMEVGRWKEKGWRWIWSMDDDFLAVPATNPAKPADYALAAWYVARDAADLILTSTPALATTFDRPSKVLVARNLCPVADYNTQSTAPLTDKPLRILWAGTRTHHDDITFLDPVVDSLLTKWSGKVEFVFVGFAPAGVLLKRWLNRGVTVVQAAELALYPQLLHNIRPHIALAPLNACRFNESKSNIRPLESWALTAAVVASPVGEYRVVQDGVTGLVAESAADWYTAVDTLISNHQLRTQLAVAGRQRVADFDWANAAARGEWKATITEMVTRVS